jgi:hypothetical protein
MASRRSWPTRLCINSTSTNHQGSIRPPSNQIWNVGAVRLSVAADGLEQAGKAGDCGGCRDRIGTLAAELRRAITDVQS